MLNFLFIVDIQIIIVKIWITPLISGPGACKEVGGGASWPWSRGKSGWHRRRGDCSTCQGKCSYSLRFGASETCVDDRKHLLGS